MSVNDNELAPHVAAGLKIEAEEENTFASGKVLIKERGEEGLIELHFTADDRRYLLSAQGAIQLSRELHQKGSSLNAKSRKSKNKESKR